jgi:hypothetical protein
MLKVQYRIKIRHCRSVSLVRLLFSYPRRRVSYSAWADQSPNVANEALMAVIAGSFLPFKLVITLYVIVKCYTM